MSQQPAVLTRIADAVYRVRLPLPWGSLDHVNVFLFRRLDGWLLLDCGLNAPATFEAYEAAFAELRIDWRAITRIVVSHLHPDHLGAAARIRRLSGAPIAMQPHEASLAAPRAVGEAFFADAEAFLRRHGVPAERIGELEAVARKSAAGSDRFVPDEEIDEGDSIEFAGGKLDVLQAPGHSPALLCFHHRDQRSLYSTDAILERISPNIGVHPFYPGNPLGEYLDSLTRLEALELDRIIPSHGEVFSDHRDWIAKTRRHHRRRLDRIEEVFRPRPLDAWTAAGEIWSEDLPAGHRRLAMAEVLAHLEYLARTGRVERREVDGAVVWQAI
jgi:glyoxylase-like metal-dependent hydrolase (beta-lactamase superfamily II)